MRTFKDGRTDATTKQRLDLAMPLKTITFVTRVTPDLDVPSRSPPRRTAHACSSPRSMARRSCSSSSVSTSRATSSSTAARCCSSSAPGTSKVKPTSSARSATPYLAAADQFRRHDLRGQRIAFAESWAVDDTTLSTQALYWDAVTPTFLNGPQDDPRFAPVLRTARVVVPAMSALAGNSGDGGQVPGALRRARLRRQQRRLFLETTQKPKLDFTGKGDRSGGLVTPNLEVRSLSRLRGRSAATRQGARRQPATGGLLRRDRRQAVRDRAASELLEALGFDPGKFPTVLVAVAEPDHRPDAGPAAARPAGHRARRRVRR